MNSTATILIVDDETRNRDLLEAILRPDGFDLATAANGQEALEKTLELKPDLILLDVMMPDITGYEVCETIRQDPELAEIPVIMVTALDDRDSRLKGIEAGADDFLTKPVDSLELKARVKTVTRLNRYRRITAEREKFGKIADFASDALFLLGKDNRVVYANEMAGKVLSTAVDSLIGKDFSDLVGARFLLQPSDAWSSWVGADEPDTETLRYLVRPEAQKGMALWLRAQLFELPATGNADWLVRLHDVTGLLNQKRDMWNYHRMLSHKLRTPMNGLIGSLSMLEDVVAEDDRDTVKDALTSAERLEEQVKDVMRYLNAPKVAREGDLFQGAGLKQRAEEYGDLFAGGDLEVRVSEDVVAGTYAIGSLAMDVILVELFENALKFHPDRKPGVILTANQIEGGACQIEVMDNGPHLGAEVLAHVMQPYFQGESKLTGEVAGMGLGLAMVSSLAWEVGGSFTLANREGDHGVIATLVIPAAKEA